MENTDEMSNEQFQMYATGMRLSRCGLLTDEVYDEDTAALFDHIPQQCIFTDGTRKVFDYECIEHFNDDVMGFCGFMGDRTPAWVVEMTEEVWREIASLTHKPSGNTLMAIIGNRWWNQVVDKPQSLVFARDLPTAAAVIH